VTLSDQRADNAIHPASAHSAPTATASSLVSDVLGLRTSARAQIQASTIVVQPQAVGKYAPFDDAVAATAANTPTASAPSRPRSRTLGRVSEASTATA
jgi:hypothetical protein